MHKDGDIREIFKLTKTAVFKLEACNGAWKTIYMGSLRLHWLHGCWVLDYKILTFRMSGSFCVVAKPCHILELH
jgi:hypothetical protein